MASAWLKNGFLLKINKWTSTPEQLDVLLVALEPLALALGRFSGR